MSNVKANEREFMSLVVSWLNEFFRTGSYPFEMASSDPSVKISEKKTKFPDIQIFITGLPNRELPTLRKQASWRASHARLSIG
jgi:ribonuclease D